MSEIGVVKISSPGRVCLFGEHQDYLGLPVIAAAVNLRARFEAAPNDSGLIKLEMTDVGGYETIDPRVEQEYRSKRDYLRSAVNVLRRAGYEFGRGFDASLRSDIPIGKGCSSSSAILVAWVALLSRMATAGEPLTPERAARTAYFAEVKEFGESGGMMDHYTSALGGLVWIETAGEIAVHPLVARLEGVFILGDSLQPKDTTGVLGSVRGVAMGGFETVRGAVSDATWENLSTEAAADALADADARTRDTVLGNIENRDITRAAIELLRSGNPEPDRIGELLTREHYILDSKIGISTPKIDGMVEASLEAGAWGAKINGSGGGGCMFAYASKEKSGAVASAIETAGGKAFEIIIDSGLMVEAT